MVLRGCCHALYIIATHNKKRKQPNYTVVYPGGAVCRSKKDISSHQLGVIPFNTGVIVEQIDSLRCQISQPLQGWVSLETYDGHPILTQNDNVQNENLTDVKYACFGLTKMTQNTYLIFKMVCTFTLFCICAVVAGALINGAISYATLTKDICTVTVTIDYDECYGYVFSNDNCEDTVKQDTYPCADYPEYEQGKQTCYIDSNCKMFISNYKADFIVCIVAGVLCIIFGIWFVYRTKIYYNFYRKKTQENLEFRMLENDEMNVNQVNMETIN